MKQGIVVWQQAQKHYISPDYNYMFDTITGYFARWGKKPEDDPKVGRLEIFDLEVSTICSGIGLGPCKHCYKSNIPRGKNMSFETFKQIFDKLPKTLTQIAFGVGDLRANPDLLKMFEYCRNNKHNPNVVPNLTINGYQLTDEWVQNLAKYCGAVAVSVYDPKDVCYDAVKKLTDAGIKQVTVHQLVSDETLTKCHEVIDDVRTDSRLEKLKAVLFLTLKPKGKRNILTITKDAREYQKLIMHAMEKNVGIGFDSCSAPTFLSAVKDHPRFSEMSMLSESCESNRFSGYANVDGKYWHCSFTEDHPNWSGIDLLKVSDFESEVWNSPEVQRFRARLLSQDNSNIDKECYLCPIYDLYDPKIGCGCK